MCIKITNERKCYLLLIVVYRKGMPMGTFLR